MKFKDLWCNKFKFILKPWTVKVLLCVPCVEVIQHEGYVDAAQQQRKLTNFGASSVTELLFSDFLVEHNLPLKTADHVAKLFRNEFPDSKMVSKYQCGCTKTTHMQTRAVAKQITINLKEELLLTCWYGLATYGSSDKDDNF